MSDAEEAKDRGEAQKRKHGEGEEEEEEDDDEWIGPMPSEAAPSKKKRILQHERLYLRNLPESEAYERSYMHRDNITFVRVAAQSEFVVTASCDGHIKFWKKKQVGIEFVKHFRAHLGNVQDVAVNHNGILLCTVSNDKHAKVFDVVNFDMINVIKLGTEKNIHLSRPVLSLHSIAINLSRLSVYLSVWLSYQRGQKFAKSVRSHLRRYSGYLYIGAL